MIVLGGSNTHGNILHIVVGLETNAWLGLHGAALANITQIINSMDHTKPIFLHFTKCSGTESEVTDFLTAAMQAGVSYPFSVPTNIFVPQNIKPAKPDAVAAEAAVAVPVAPDLNKCSRCGNAKCELVPKVSPNICYACLSLDLMLAANRKQRKVAKPSVKSDANDKPDITV